MNHLATAPAAPSSTRAPNPRRPATRPEITAHLALVSAMATRMARSKRIDLCLLERDDLVSIGTEALFEAAQRFDPSRGATFVTFAYHRVQGAMLDALRASGCYRSRKTDRPHAPRAVFTTSLDADEELSHSIPDSAPTPDEAADASRASYQLHEAIAALPALERCLLMGYYFEDRTLDELGAEIGKSRSWTCRLLQRAIASLGVMVGARD